MTQQGFLVLDEKFLGQASRVAAFLEISDDLTLAHHVAFALPHMPANHLDFAFAFHHHAPHREVPPSTHGRVAALRRIIRARTTLLPAQRHRSQHSARDAERSAADGVQASTSRMEAVMKPTWKKPRFVEIACGLEINTYAPA